jgi:hypothetical protein
LTLFPKADAGYRMHDAGYNAVIFLGVRVGIDIGVETHQFDSNTNTDPDPDCVSYMP